MSVWGCIGLDFGMIWAIHWHDLGMIVAWSRHWLGRGFAWLCDDYGTIYWAVDSNPDPVREPGGPVTRNSRIMGTPGEPKYIRIYQIYQNIAKIQ